MGLVSASNARSFALHGETFNSFVGGATGSKRFAAWRTDFAPVTPGAAHVMSEDEVIHVLLGELEIELGDERFTARAGDAVLVPAGVAFRVSNETEHQAQIWAVTARGMKAAMVADGVELAPSWAQ